MTFASIWILPLVWLVPVFGGLCVYFHIRREKDLALVFTTEMLAKLAPPARRVPAVIQLAATLVSLVLIAIALARPQWGQREETVYHRGRDLVIALDVSRSMLARDVIPNRLARARADLLDLIRETHGDRVSLIAFRGSANLLCPLTTDHTYLKHVLDGVDTDSAPHGATDIGAAIAKALETFESDQGSHKAIILISDGEDLAEQAVAEAAKAGERGIPIFAVGIGDPAGSPIPSEERRDAFVMQDGQQVMTKLNHATLSAIADKTGGVYLPVGRGSLAENTLGTIYRQHVSRVTSQDLEESVQKKKIERFQLFLLPGILAMLVATFFSRGRLAPAAPLRRPDSQPPLKAISAALLLMLCGSITAAYADEDGMEDDLLLDSLAEDAERDPDDVSEASPTSPSTTPGRSGARKAQRYYRLGMYKKAAELYKDAARGATRKSQNDFLHNAAVALSRADQHAKAATTLEQLRGMTGGDTYDTTYNLGIARYRESQGLDSDSTNSNIIIQRAQRIRQSAESFLHARRLKPKSPTAAAKLAMVEGELTGAEEAANLARLMARFTGKGPFDIADTMLQAQRDILENVPVAATNETPRRIALFESLAERQRSNAEIAAPLKARLHELSAQKGDAIDPETLEKVSHFLDETQERMLSAATQLRDLDVQGYQPGAQAEAELFGLWKSLAPYGPLLKEDLRKQTNVIQVTQISGAQATPQALQAFGHEQTQAAELTRLFLERFSEAWPEGVATAPSAQGTNAPAPPLSEEDRQAIIELANQAIEVQEQSATSLGERRIPDALSAQRHGYALLKQIEKLLPRSDDPSQQEQEQEQEQQQQSPDESETEQQDQAEPDEPTPPENQQEEQASESEEPADDSMTLEQAQRLLEKVLQREKEYLEAKRRNEYVPMGAVNRDW